MGDKQVWYYKLYYVLNCPLTIFPVMQIIHRGRKGTSMNGNNSPKIYSVKKILQVFLLYYLLEKASSCGKPRTYLTK